MRYDDGEALDPQVDMERLQAFALSAPDPRRQNVPGIIEPAVVGVSTPPPTSSGSQLHVPSIDQSDLHKVAQSLALLRSSVVAGPSRLNLQERPLRLWQS